MSSLLSSNKLKSRSVENLGKLWKNINAVPPLNPNRLHSSLSLNTMVKIWAM